MCCLSSLLAGCGHGRPTTPIKESTELSKKQEQLLKTGWYFSKKPTCGELPKEYGVKSRYGQQDNYFDIVIGNGYDVAIKIIDVVTDNCIRYVFVPENSSANIQMIPQGKYYLKLAYGKEWMEYDNGTGTIDAKFTKNVKYDRSIDIFDFGKKNSSDVISFVLKINIADSELQNNFRTAEISETEFMK